MTRIENCRLGKFITVDFHHMRIDGGLNATARGCDWPLSAGDKVIAIDLFSDASCAGTVRAVGQPSQYGRGDVVLDLDGDTWSDD